MKSPTTLLAILAVIAAYLLSYPLAVSLAYKYSTDDGFISLIFLLYWPAAYLSEIFPPYDTLLSMLYHPFGLSKDPTSIPLPQ